MFDRDDIQKLSRDSILETRMRMEGYFVLKARLRYTDGAIKIEPPAEKWLEAFVNTLTTFEEQSNGMPCFNADDTFLGPVWADSKTHIFLPEETI